MVETLHNGKEKWLLGYKETCPNHSPSSQEAPENDQNFSLDSELMASFLVLFLSAEEGTNTGFCIYVREVFYH